MVHPLKNPDGTVNFDNVKKETNYLKAKYAQNAENARKNAEREQQHDQSGTPSSGPQQGHGDIAPAKAEGAQ